MKRVCYTLKRTVGAEFIELKPDQYKVVGLIGQFAKVAVTIQDIQYTMTFKLTKKGNSYYHRSHTRRNEQGKYIIYTIPV